MATKAIAFTMADTAGKFVIPNECVPANVVYCDNLFKRVMTAPDTSIRRNLYGSLKSSEEVDDHLEKRSAQIHMLFNARSVAHIDEHAKVTGVRSKLKEIDSKLKAEIESMPDSMYASGIITQNVDNVTQTRQGGDMLVTVDDPYGNTSEKRYLIQPIGSSRTLFPQDTILAENPVFLVANKNTAVSKENVRAAFDTMTRA